MGSSGGRRNRTSQHSRCRPVEGRNGMNLERKRNEMRGKPNALVDPQTEDRELTIKYMSLYKC